MQSLGAIQLRGEVRFVLYSSHLTTRWRGHLTPELNSPQSGGGQEYLFTTAGEGAIGAADSCANVQLSSLNENAALGETAILIHVIARIARPNAIGGSYSS